MTASASMLARQHSVEPAAAYFEALNGFVLDELTDLIGFKHGALALHKQGFEWVGDIVAADEARLLAVPGIGQRKLEVIKDYLAARGLTLNKSCQAWLDYRAKNAREVKGPVELHSNAGREAMARLVSRLKAIELKV